MALPPYNRSFNAGHQSELLYNDKLHQHFKATEHLLDKPAELNTPAGELDGELWLKRPGDELKSFHKNTGTWHNIFNNKFQIIDQIYSETAPESPVVGQLWICNGVLLCFNGTSWFPVKTLEQKSLQAYLAGLNDFAFISPLTADNDSNTNNRFLIPDVNANRVFLNNDLNFQYHTISNICISYDLNTLAQKIPSLVHVNAGRLSKIHKRLFRFDKDNPVLDMFSANTEFYGFCDYDSDGNLLIPKTSGDTFDYEVMDDGIYLSDDVAEKFDYILAVTYEFDYSRSAGSLDVVKVNSNRVKRDVPNFFDVTVSHFDESLIYRNGKLLCNHTAVSSDIPLEKSDSAEFINNFRHNEIRCFIPADKMTTTDPLNGVYCYWHSALEKWIDLDLDNISGVKAIVSSYENSTLAVDCNFTFNPSDDIRVYAFRYSNSALNPPVIKNIDCTTPKNEFTVAEKFIPAENSLSVYVNGIRQYDIEEHIDGISFKLPASVTGTVTYVIERPENGYTQTAEREILDSDNVVPNTINVYQTNISLYPGRVILYINGLRQSQDSFTILDNHTFIINSDQMLIGNQNNFPLEKLEVDNDVKYITHTSSDRILVEVKHDYNKIENAVKVDKFTDSSLNLNDYDDLPKEILQTKENIFFYVNGLFTGLNFDDDYSLDFYGNAIRFKNSAFVETLSSNALTSLVNSDKNIKHNYYIFNQGTNYDKPLDQLILEWRS